MKKTLALLLSIVAVSSQAVSFSWTSKDQVTFGGTTLNSSGNTATAYLVYLGTDGAWSFGETFGTLANITDSSVDTSATRTTGSASQKGKVQQKTWGEDGNAGSTYGVVLTYTDSNETIWYNISSDTYTIPAGTADNALDLSNSFLFSFASGGEVQKLSAAQVGGGWHSIATSPTPPSVPEPGTAALALLGVGLLFKRRKA